MIYIRHLLLAIIPILFSFSLATTAQAAPFNPYDSQSPVQEQVPEYFFPRNMLPMVAQLPEYSNVGPGYICDLRQAPAVYRYPLQYYRHIGYREPEWVYNKMLDKHVYPLNYGGYTY